MKSTQTAEADLQQTLQAFMQSMPSSPTQTHSKKVKLTTHHPQTGQAMTVEMEQTTQAVVMAHEVMNIANASQRQVSVPPQSALVQAFPGASIIEKIIAGHISYIIIPVCGIIIAWSYNQMSGGHALLGTAIFFFSVSIILELGAKLMHFPEIDKKLDEKLQGQKVRLKSKAWLKEGFLFLLENLKASHIKLAFQWTGIALAFLGCLLMISFFLHQTSSIVGGSVNSNPYSVSQSGSPFTVR